MATPTRSTVPGLAAGRASSSASISSSAASVSFWPSRSKNLTPLYSGGLCDAEMTTPRSSASSATAGGGGTPAGAGGGRDPPGEDGVPACRDDTACERLLEFDARCTCVAADEDAPASRPERCS